MNLDFLREAYLAIGSLFFSTLILVLYMKKNTKFTLESGTFNLLLIVTELTLVFEINVVLARNFVASVVFISLLYKLKEICCLIFAFTISYYLVVSIISNNDYSGNFSLSGNKLFRRLLFLYFGVIFVFIIAILFLDMSVTSSVSETLSNFIVKCGIISFLSFLFQFFLIIIFKVIFKNDDKKSYIIRIVVSLLVNILIIIGIILLPSNFAILYKNPFGGNGIYIKPIYLLFIAISTELFISIYYKKFNIKKYFPFFITVPLVTVACLCESFLPGTITFGVVGTFLVVNIYDIIENPDEKMLEEINKNAVIADNANRQKTRFLSNMSHEIRTPLNAIIGFSQVLKEENISNEAKEEVDDIIMSSNSLLEIVNGILDISKIESNKLEIENKEYDSKKMFKEILSLAKARLASRPIELKASIDESIPPVLNGDYLRVKQIFINILTNAIKYTREGTIEFDVSYENKGSNILLKFRVKDTGIGIKEEDLNKLFSKFQRLDLEKNSSTEGTGLGLAITKSLVELMDGTIDVKSEYGKGTEFDITILQGIGSKKLEEINKVEETTSDIKLNMSKDILVVDDNTVNLKVTNRLLQDYKVNVTLANSGEECINIIKNGKKFDLIFMDDMMPKMTGTETMQILKGMSSFDIPIVVLTANAISGMREKYLNAGFDEYLAKPIDKHQLNNIINYFLNKNMGNTTIEIKGPHTLHDDAFEETKEDLSKTSFNIDRSDEVVEEVIQVEEVKNNFDIDANSSHEESINNHTKEFLESCGIDVDHGLELLGDMETYDMAMEEFEKNYDDRINKIKSCKDNNDMPNYAIEVHAMKSDSKYLGFMTLADISYEHEMASKANEVDKVNDRFDALIDEADKIIKAVRKYMGKE